MLDPIKHLEVFLYDESPDSRALTDSGVTFREEFQAFARPDNHRAQFLRRRGIVNSDQSNDSLKVFQEGVLEDYLEVHSPSRARTSRAECP